jgi:hypothetical protein
MRPSILRPLALAAALALSACQAYPTTPVAAVGAPQDGILLQGRVAFPGYGVLAVESDVSRQSAIALIDATGVTRAAGTTDASGAFTLYRSTTAFAPQTGDVFTLEAMRRQDVGTERRWLTLRTLVRRTASGWTSLSGPAVTLSLTSTALYTILAAEPALRDAAWGSITGSTPGDLPGYPASAIQAMGAQLAAQLAAGDDPSGGLVHEGDYTIRTQADVDALQGYSRIKGNLVVESNTLATFEAPFLRVVDGYVHVDSDSLTDLRGFGSLVACQSFTLWECSALTDLTGLARLADTDDLHLSNCWGLTSLAGLEALTGVKNLIIRQCSNLTSLAGLEGLTRIGGVSLESNGLTSLSGLNGLTTAGAIVIQFNHDLVSLSGLENLTTVENLTVSYNNTLPSLEGLNALTTITGTIEVKSNERLASFAGLEALTTIGETLSIEMMPLVTSLSPLSRLESVGALYINQLPALNTSAGFEKLTALRFLWILNCPALTGLDGFAALTTLGTLWLNDASLCGVTLPNNPTPGYVMDQRVCAP